MKIYLAVIVILISISDIVSDDDDGIYNNRLMVLDMGGQLKKKFLLAAALAAPERNMVCSPLSALLPLGKMALGAQGKGKEELYSAIGVKNHLELKATFERIIFRLKNLRGVIIDVASRLYVTYTARVKPTFNGNATEIFQSGCERVDFGAPSHTAEYINSWVSKNTNGMIPYIISPADISPACSLIVVNAIYFNGGWRHPFYKATEGTFHSPQGERNVLMMHQKETHNYYNSSTLNCEIIELPYKNELVSFLIILPYNDGGLPELLNTLNNAPYELNSEMGKMMKTQLDLSMPKFKVQTNLDLNILYKKVGVRAIFGDVKALPDIIYGTLTLTSSVQRAIIEVTETGTQAAAATMSNLVATSYVERVRVNVNRPFLFIVKVKQQQLFAGIFNDPSKLT